MRPPRRRYHDQFSAVQWVVVLAGSHSIDYIYPNDSFWVNKIFFKNYFQKNQLAMSDSRPKYKKNLTVKLAQPKFNLTLPLIIAQFDMF